MESFWTQLFTKLYNHYKSMIFHNKRSYESIYDLGSPFNVFLITFESKILRHNFSSNCTNIEKVSFFAIGGLSNLFGQWGVQITCFLDHLNRKFSDKTFHQMSQALRKFDFLL